MQKCYIYHTGLQRYEEGIIRDDIVYAIGTEGVMYAPEKIFLAKDECEGGLVQILLNKKWGYARVDTGKIVIPIEWDYAGPFYGGFAHVSMGNDLEIVNHTHIYHIGGKHGFINLEGKTVIPLVYDDAIVIPRVSNFEVARRRKWGLIDTSNKELIPIEYDLINCDYESNIIFCAKKYVGENDSDEYNLRWHIYDKDGNRLINMEFDEEPFCPIYNNEYYPIIKYYVVNKSNQYGVICNDGTWIASMGLEKEHAIELIEGLYKK